jgi:hypothetical protein
MLSLTVVPPMIAVMVKVDRLAFGMVQSSCVRVFRVLALFSYIRLLFVLFNLCCRKKNVLYCFGISGGVVEFSVTIVMFLSGLRTN